MIRSFDKDTSTLATYILVDLYNSRKIDNKLFLCLLGSTYIDIEVDGVNYNAEYFRELKKELFLIDQDYTEYKKVIINTIKTDYDNKQTVG